MAVFTNGLLIVGMLFVLQDAVLGLRCYKCTSFGDGQCGADFVANDDENLVECSNEATLCYEATVDVSGEIVFARDCTTNCMMPDADLGGLEDFDVKKLDCCSDEKCNDGVPDDLPTALPPVQLQCYSCSSDSPGPCSDQFWNSNSLEVSTDACFGSCLVQTQTIGGETSFYRSCASTCVSSTEHQLGISQSLTCCNSNFCNEGNPDAVLTCYACNSIDDVGCGDASWDSSGLDTVQCAGFCTATKTLITGNEVIVRGCASTCVPYLTPDGQIVSQCCDENYCNRGKADGSVNPPLLMCYECSSSGDGDCGEVNFDYNMVASICQGWCKTTKEFDNAGGLTITRECAETECIEAAGPGGDVNCCDSDYCLPNIDRPPPMSGQCFSCNSEEYSCPDETFDRMEVNTVNCGGPCQTIILTDQGQKFYQRACSKFCVPQPASASSSVEVQCCEGYECNKPLEVNQGSEVTCHSCTSILSDGCGASVDTDDFWVSQETCFGSCQTSYAFLFDGDPVYARGCAEECVAESSDLGNIASAVECCTSDFCNGNFEGPSQVTPGPGQILCHQCTSVLGTGCGVTLDLSGDWTSQTPCDGPCTISYLDFGDGDPPIITRTCDVECEEADTGGLGIRVKTTCCNSNLCNVDLDGVPPDVPGDGNGDGDGDGSSEMTCYACSSVINGDACAANLNPSVAEEVSCDGRCSVSMISSALLDQVTYTRACTPGCTASNTGMQGFASAIKCCNSPKCNGDYDSVNNGGNTSGEDDDLMCYACMSDGNDACAQDIDKDALSTVTCDGQCAVTEETTNAGSRYIRECREQCKENEVGTEGTTVTTKCCKSNKCNGNFDGGQGAVHCSQALLMMMLMVLLGLLM